MPTCIYCRTSASGKFPREHVIPQSFGSFRGGLTLGCVCGECNRYFGKHLETQFARESAESIARFWHGVREEESATRTSQATARVNDSGPRHGAKVLLRPNAGKDGIDLQYLPQVAFRNSEAEDWRWYTSEELNGDVMRTLEAGSQLKYFVTSPAQEEQLRSRLRELGLTGTKPIRRDVFPPEREIKTNVKCIFDFNMARCVAKIAFNYFAYIVQENHRRLLREDFDAIRKFVTDGSHPEYPVVYFSAKPALERPNKQAFIVGHVLAVDWDADGNITCGLSLFNAMAYRVVICNKYSGLWFPLVGAHSFDFRTKEAAKIPLSVLAASVS